ncbi:MAG TPA: GGDEF domain-containing protein [Acidobacteriaceae bacterium]
MLAGHARPDDATLRTDQERDQRVPTGSHQLCDRGFLPPGFRALLTFLLLSLLFGGLTPLCRAVDHPDAASQKTHPWLVIAAHTPGLHATRNAIQNSRLHSMIEQVRFNQTELPFDQGVTVGPGAGSLVIQFTASASEASDPLHYRLLGFDTEWKEAGKNHEVLYDHLAPGRYEFDLQQAETSSLRDPVVESFAITVVSPYWQTGWFRILSTIFLLFLILALHKIRVDYLLRQQQKLQEAVAQTKAELTLAAKIAGDAQEALKEQALKDGLTGLWNRRAIFAMLEREVCRAQRDKFPITLLMVDMDHFKNINDTHGHLTGDEVLREAAARLSEVMRPYDFAGRYGGEEFLVVLPSCSPQNGLQRAEDFRRAIGERLVPTALGPLTVTCSVGMASYDGKMPLEDLIHRADNALYRAKKLGRNCVCAETSLRAEEPTRHLSAVRKA